MRWNRSVALLVFAQFCTSSASIGGVTALGKQVYDLTGRELDLGLLGLAEFAPAAALVLLTGRVADRFDRARVGSVAAALEAVTAAGLAAYALGSPSAVAPIFALVIAFGTARAFVAPAVRALPADIAGDGLPWLVARLSITWQVAMIVGPVAAGVLYVVHPAAPYIAMATLLACAALALALVDAHRADAVAPAPVGQPPAAERATDELQAALDPLTSHGAAAEPTRRGLRDAVEGLSIVRRDPVLFGAISLDLFAVLFGGAVALLPAIAEDRLGVGAVGLGWLRAAGGIGAAVVTFTLMRRPIERRVGRRLLVAVALFGVATIVLGWTRSFAVAFVAVAVLSGADAVSVFVRSTLVPLATPPHARGRVLAVENVFIGASNELGAFESGVTGHLLGASGAVVLGGAATIAIAGIWWRGFPALRNVDRFPNPSRAGGGQGDSVPRPVGEDE